jgi:hypothetical protein
MPREFFQEKSILDIVRNIKISGELLQGSAPSEGDEAWF